MEFSNGELKPLGWLNEPFIKENWYKTQRSVGIEPGTLEYIAVMFVNKPRRSPNLLALVVFGLGQAHEVVGSEV